MGRVVRNAIRGLREQNVDPVLVVRTRQDARPLHQEFDLHVITPAHIRAEKFDAVWYPWNGIRFNSHGFAAVTIHDPFAFTYPHRNLVARYREQHPIRRALFRADRIFAVSRWTAGELDRLFGAAAPLVQVVCNAPDPFFRPVPSANAKPYYFFLAGAEERKNAAMLLRAYDAAFSAGGPRLIIGGDLNARDTAALARMRAPVRRVHPDDEESAGAL